MKDGITPAPTLRLLVCPRVPAAVLHRLAGLLIAVGIPVVFWTLALLFVSRALGIEIGAAGLTGCGLAIGAWCLLVVAAMMAGHRNGT